MKLKIITLLATFALISPGIVSALILDITGGDCLTVGTWDAPTQTCTLSQDIANNSISITSDNITLDGAGYTITGAATSTGISASLRQNIIIKNLTLSGFSKAVSFGVVKNSRIENSTFTGNATGIRADTVIYSDASRNIIRNNTFTNNRTAVSLNATQGDIVEGNTITGTLPNDTGIILLANNSIPNIIRNNIITGPGSTGIRGNDSDSDEFTGNSVKNFSTGLHFTSCSIGHVFKENTVEGNTLGAFFAGSSGTFSRNNFKNNAQDIQNARASCGNGTETLSKPLPDGGNFWGNNTTCADANHDNICDSTYAAATTTDNATNLTTSLFDNFPWTVENGWTLPTTSPTTLSNPTETEDDNNQDEKGVADKTNFTFSVTVDGTPDSVNLIVGSVTGTTTLPISHRLDLWEIVSTFPKGKYTWHIEASAGGQTVRTPDRNFTTGYSNVAFLPGIMGSRLFEQSSICAFTTEEEHWVSRSDCDHKRLALDASGKSIYPLYTKEGADGAIDDTYGFNIYQSFMGDLEKWKNTDHIIADYKIIPYDWRLSLEDILQNGATTTGRRLSYDTSQGFYSSYIYKQIRALQESSDTGKVSIIAHSNGGLVTKAFVQKLKDQNDPLANQIDDIIMVAVPQAGTPDAIGGLLHGTKLGHGIVMGKERSRDLLRNMPVGYNLLPSRTFPVSSADPFIEFTGDFISSAIRLRYGDSIDTYTELTDYLLGGDGRSAPAYDDIDSPAIANGNLLSGADAVHVTLDHFTPGNGTTVYEIAGWGRYTPAGVRYRKNRECIRVTETFSPIGTPRPLHCAEYRDTVKIDYRDTINGDATVIDKSAHLMPESATTKKFWVNLEKYNTQPRTIDREHRDILEVDILRPFIKSLIVKNISTPEFITNDSDTLIPTSGVYVKYEIHSPLNINVYDNLGNHTGISTTTGLIEEGIEGSQYLELGDSKAIIVPAETAHTLNMDAYASGSFTLDIETLAGDTITASTTFEAVPTATTTKAIVEWNPETGIGSSTLDIDFNADNIIDTSLASVINGTALYDVTPPEAVISFSTTTNDIVITGRDAGGETTIQTTATSITITDQAGNTLVIPFTKYKEKSTKLKIVFDTLVYNGVATIIPKTTLEYEWEMKNRILKELKQDVRIKNTQRVSAEYEAKKNQTKIIDKVKEEGEKSITKSTKPGIAILTISTRDGVVGVQY